MTDEERRQRLFLAEEVCYTLLLAMEFDLLPADKLTQQERDFIAIPMEKWAKVAMPDGQPT